MVRTQPAGIPPGLIWVIGLPLLLVVSLSSKYWQDVAAAVGSGHGALNLQTPSTYQGLWRLGGLLLLLWLLSLWAQASESGGVFGVIFLVILWAFWLVQSRTAVAAVLNKFTQAG